jgi:threonine dehydrogenase-like Zn-dependent dehydrogenase
VRAAVTRAKSVMEVADVGDPGEPGPGELLVRPEVVGLCGSDFHYFHGDIGLTEDPDDLYPRIQGHEFSAIVEHVGPECPPGLAVGQRIAVWPVTACGACACCRMDRENACENISLIGIHKNGALQERLAIPAHQAFPVELDDPRLAAFVEPMSIAVRTVVRARLEPGERVLVLGAGPIGQAVAIAALDRGASVLLADRVAARLERSASGAALALATDDDSDLLARVRDWAGGELPEVVVEATGSKQAMRASLDLVAAAGRVLVVGLSAHEVPLRIGALPFRELDVLGVSTCQSGDFAAAAELVHRRREAVSPLITHEFSLAEAPHAITFAIEHPADVLKAVVHLS